MTIPPISEATIRHHATSSSFDRGEDYYERGCVTDLVQRGNLVQAEVEGSEATPYRVTLQFDAGGITSAQCTCPYNFEGWCKHIVAAALTCVRQPDRLETRPTLVQLLDRLDAVQTQRLVQAIVEEHPELIELVDRQVMLMTNPAPPKQTAKSRRSTVDVVPYRRQVKQILREAVRAMEDGYEEDPITEELQEVIDKALAFARNGDGESAIAILDAITSACVADWDDIIDYGGDSFPIVEALNEAWTEAILSTEISEPQAIDLRVMLENWQDELDGDFAMSLAALAQGWDDPELQRVFQGNYYANPDRLNSDFSEFLALIRLQILDRQERQTEYLNLARAEGLTQQYLTRLAEIGEIEAVMAAAPTELGTAEEAFAVAKTLRSGNHLPEALSIAQAGLSLPGHCRYDLASWTSELAEGLGDPDLALKACILAFETRPSFADYRRVQQLAGNRWDQIKLDLLKALRQYREWGADQAKVDIFLHENLLDDAIATVRSDNYYHSDLLLRVMQATLAYRPDWVIEAARNRAEPIMDQGKADRYDNAVQWLQQVKAAYLQSGQEAAWTAYFSQLQTTHSRKRKLMELFKPLR